MRPRSRRQYTYLATFILPLRSPRTRAKHVDCLTPSHAHISTPPMPMSGQGISRPGTPYRGSVASRAPGGCSAETLWWLTRSTLRDNTNALLTVRTVGRKEGRAGEVDERRCASGRLEIGLCATSDGCAVPLRAWGKTLRARQFCCGCCWRSRCSLVWLHMCLDSVAARS